MRVRIKTKFRPGIGNVVKGVTYDCSCSESLLMVNALSRLAKDPEAHEQTRQDAKKLCQQIVDESEKQVMVKDPIVNAFYNENEKTLVIAMKGDEPVDLSDINNVVINDWNGFQAKSYKGSGKPSPIIKELGVK